MATHVRPGSMGGVVGPDLGFLLQIHLVPIQTSAYKWAWTDMCMDIRAPEQMWVDMFMDIRAPEQMWVDMCMDIRAPEQMWVDMRG